MPRKSNKQADLSAVLNNNPVLDMDNVYWSDKGWAYRHYKNETKTRFWDEILVAGEALLDNGNTDTTAFAFGTASPTFETGDGVVSPLLSLAPASIDVPSDILAEETGIVFAVSIDPQVTDATYQWSLVDEGGASAITAGATAASATVTAGADAGTYTIRCVVSSATANDSPLTVEAEYTVIEA